MNPYEIARYRGQRVDLRFSDGGRARAQIITVDPAVRQHQVFYDVLEVLETGSSYDPPIFAGEAYACAAEDILELLPTDGLVYPPRSIGTRPSWKFW